MNTLWYTDGTDRRQFEGRKDIPCRVAMIEDDYRVLMGRVMDMAGSIRYYNLKNQPEGYWRELFRYQPLAILSEIERTDIHELENRFLKSGRRQPEMMLKLAKELMGRLDDWELRLVYYPRLQLAKDLSSRTKFRLPEEKDELKKSFYALLGTVRKLQVNYERYREEIRTCGENDPAAALLDSFLRNYEEIANRFNARWQTWPDFYFREILHAGCRGIVPDWVWLSVVRVPGSGCVVIPEATAFVAGKNKGGGAVCYRSVEEVVVEDMKLAQLRSFFQEKDGERYPAARLGFVTAISQNTIDLEDIGDHQKLFGEASDSRLEMGLMICSSMLLLREGRRRLTVSFYLTEEGSGYFQKILNQVTEGAEENSGESVVKLLKDAFCLDITTGIGWEHIEEYVATFRDKQCISLLFCLDKEFPATASGDISLHGVQTQWPVLRIRMNPEAWLFPYSWMSAVKCNRVKLNVEVAGLSTLKLYNNIGELDTSTPFYPFGVQPARGAQVVFGSYEMAVKSLQKVNLYCKWLQLPSGPEGFYGHYREYGQQIDNYSFRVRTEWLDGKKWKSDQVGIQGLFGSPGDGYSTAKGALPEESRVSWSPDGNIPVAGGNEDRYAYGMSSSGFFRMVLDEPEMGFGHALYHTLFAEVMIANAHRKRPLPAPALPVSPLIESVEVSYESEEELYFTAGQNRGNIRLFYMDSMGFSTLESIGSDAPFYLAKRLGEAGNLLFGFTKAVGIDRIRFFVDIAAVRQEIDLRDDERQNLSPVWYIRQKENWIRLTPDALVRDTTGGFISSGIVELLLPVPVAEDWLDENGIFWLGAQFGCDVIKQVAVKGFYTNVVEAVLDTDTVDSDWEWDGELPEGTITAAVRNIPGVADIRQIVSGKGGRKEEDEETLKIRMIHRIRHRNRVVTPRDFEDRIMEEFPHVAKVNCLPGVDSKNMNRQGIVTLAVVPRLQNGVGFPLCTHDLLLEIERFLQPLAGAFVQVDAINPLYEEMKVRCNIGIGPGWSAAETILRLRRRIDDLIVPWKNSDGIPVFGYRFGLQELKNRIMEDEGVSVLHGLSVLQVCREGRKLYRLGEVGDQSDGDQKIGASCAWGIPVPAPVHLIRTDKEDIWRPEAGIGEIGVEETFIIR